VEDREVSALNCQTPSSLQRGLIGQLCKDHLFLSFLNPLLMETHRERTVLPDEGRFPCRKQPGKVSRLPRAGAAFQPRSYDAAALARQRILITLKQRKMNFPRGPSTCWSLDGGAGPGASHSQSVLSNKFPRYLF